ncbi:MAG TPA: DinB family protein [Thermoanaerobaculia bacterium]|nr:DinB family protein [Thermoanaerobaculia bacterium]
MYKFILALCCAFSVFAAEPMTDAEKKSLLEHLDRTSANFAKSIEGASEAQWTFKSAPDRWSLAECSEHIIAAESFIRDAFAGSMKAPASAEMLANARRETMLEKAVLDRSKAFQAPEPIRPSGQKFRTAAEAIAAFREQRQKTIELVQNGGDLRSFAMEHPFGGPLDVYGWVTFLSAHTGRHTLQIEEVKAHANYPK